MYVSSAFTHVNEPVITISTKTLVLYWVYVDYPMVLYRSEMFQNDIGPILAASRWFTDGQLLVKWWILHLANIIPSNGKW